MSLTDDLETIVDHEKQPRESIRASQAEQRGEQLAETRARNTMLEYENQMRLTVDDHMLHDRSEFDLLLWQSCNPKDLKRPQAPECSIQRNIDGTEKLRACVSVLSLVDFTRVVNT